MTSGTKISAWLQRGDHHEVLINNQFKSIMELEPNSIIGTSSIRRRSQVLNLRSDLAIKLIRGNVDTRIDKLNRNEYDALILGQGGIKRLNFQDKVAQVFSINEILPPACQASIGIQTLDEDNELTNKIKKSDAQPSECRCNGSISARTVPGAVNISNIVRIPANGVSNPFSSATIPASAPT